ncbi:MAG TPA: HNH endonuclease [Polyangiaceae bacterium]|jgi:hypothetical protein|nr:HNH endonuclease [Polyangiaceae bacterium]
MALLTKVEAAIALGVSMELLDWFVLHPAKPKESRQLRSSKVEGVEMFDEAELHGFRIYLHSPWPKPKKGRPHLPAPIKDDIKVESHLSCAVCGLMNRNEVAHIVAVADSLNNGPDNLIFLCPNHHEQFDYGYKPKNSVSVEAIKAAKTIKRCARARVLRIEANATKAVLALIRTIGEFETKLKTLDPKSDVASVYLTEARELMALVPEYSARAQEVGRDDQSFEDDVAKTVAQRAPELSKLAVPKTAKEPAARAAMQQLREAVADMLPEFDDIDCPHCGGSGTRGLCGDFCSYCRGSQQVSREKADSYDEADFDEGECPRCGGSGTVGLRGDFCPYCRGAQLITKTRAESFDEAALDEVDCPHCEGAGTHGLQSDFCRYCGGSQTISRAKAEAYDVDDIDEVDCPHCEGSGTYGLQSEFCRYCRGSQKISGAKADAYEPDDIDEVDCPHCGGTGTIGLMGDFCRYCQGAQRVSSAKAKKYDEAAMDEEECPRCGGGGTTGLAGDICKLCKGQQRVPAAKADAYRARKG